MYNLLPNFRGMYVCRTLSYKGAEFEVIEAPLEAEMEVCKFIFICFLVKLFIQFYTLKILCASLLTQLDSVIYEYDYSIYILGHTLLAPSSSFTKL